MFKHYWNLQTPGVFILGQYHPNIKKDETYLFSYRPIALLGCDLEMFTKILANRLNKCILTIIHQDQTGFIAGRFSFSNIRRLMNIKYSKHDKGSKVAILALDAQKEYFQLEWNYILTIIHLFALGESCPLGWNTICVPDGFSSLITINHIRFNFTVPTANGAHWVRCYSPLLWNP